jgi:hypothetical protein
MKPQRERGGLPGECGQLPRRVGIGPETAHVAAFVDGPEEPRFLALGKGWRRHEEQLTSANYNASRCYY